MKKSIAIVAIAAAFSMTSANAWFGNGYNNGWNDMMNDMMGDGAFDMNMSARGNGWGRNNWRDYMNHYGYPSYGYGYPYGGYGYPYGAPVAPYGVAPVAPQAPAAAK